MILLIDNYDSFVFNLARYFEELGCETWVVRHDGITLEEIAESRPQAIVISPGPKTPDEAGISVWAIKRFAGEIPLLGVCLGHQAIAAAFGGSVVRAPEPIHGRSMVMLHNRASELFEGVPEEFTAARYHSLVVKEDSLPQELRVTCRSADGVTMAIEHRELPIYGIQFHPESILTDVGHRLLENFLRIARVTHQAWTMQERPGLVECDDFFQRPIEGNPLP